ncbi:hypothetical protein HAHE_11480 [Haloferula helveola]|uniref:Glycine transporter domain-containing protein n=1 Tax=Haloferula helveola TaxID=490095 RepID=A0ABM7RD01_9BACT|nr:hypothetical protein HAHE_11480 [Haloferula helveola]
MNLLFWWEVVGTFVFCVSGAVAARGKDMDWFGMFVVGLITGTGGGMLRSFLIGDLPPVFLRDPLYFGIAGLATVIAVAGAGWWERVRRAVSVLDAFGLGLFVVTGMRIAQAHGLAPWAALALGVISATFGGLLRDVIRNEVPLVLRREIYATACIAGGLVLIGLDALGSPEGLALAVTTAVVVTIRLLAIRYAIHRSEA